MGSNVVGSIFTIFILFIVPLITIIGISYWGNTSKLKCFCKNHNWHKRPDIVIVKGDVLIGYCSRCGEVVFQNKQEEWVLMED
jgi:hypothetical protein